MSKISEQKALEEYPKSYVDENTSSREGYIKGYDQAMQDLLKDANQYMFLSDEIGYAYASGCKKTMQDFLEKAESWLEPIFKNLAGYNCGGDLINDFKNYMEEEL